MPTPHTAFRLSEADLAMLDKLGKLWSPRSPLNRTAVLRVILKDRYDLEMGWIKAKGNPARAAGREEERR